MSDYTRDQLYDALRKADAAGDAEAAKALVARIQSMDAPQGEGLQVQVSYEGPNEWTAEDTVDYAKDSAKNIGVGMAQGALGLVEFPLNVARTVNRGINYGLREGGGSLLDLIGAEGAADWWRGDGQEVAPIPLPSEQLESAFPTPEGMAGQRFASQLVGGMAVPFGPKPAYNPNVSVAQAAPAAKPNNLREIVEAGAENNVRVMTSDVKPPKTFLTRLAQGAGERIPFAGTGGPRAAQQNERVQAVTKLAEDFGVEVGGDYVEDVARDLAKTRGARIAALTTRKDAVIDGVQGAVQTPRAAVAIDQEIARLQATNNPAVQPVIDQLTRFKGAIGSGLSLRNIEENRRILGKAFEGDKAADIKDIGEKSVRAIYAPLRDDMAAHIRANGGDEALATWKKANEELSTMAGELSVASFRRVLNDAEATPESVARLILSAKPSDVRRLMENVSPEGRSKAQAAIIQRALQKAGDDVSPDKFANELTRLGRQVGVVFEGQDLARVQGLERLLQATKRAAQASATPPTGVQNMPIIGGFALGATFEPTTATAIAGGIGAAARAWESPAVRNLLIGLSKTKPGSKGESRMLERIEKIMASQTSINSPANDTLGMPLAAGQTEEQ